MYNIYKVIQTNSIIKASTLNTGPIDWIEHISCNNVSRSYND
jgi:hypothetical protein